MDDTRPRKENFFGFAAIFIRIKTLEEILMKKFWIIAAMASLLFVSDHAVAATASAEIRGTDPKSKITGKVFFKDSPEGLNISAEVHHVPAGKHGFHVHENGSCSDKGKAAGDHFNPDKVKHGLIAKDGFSHAHAGDMGNIEADKNGDGKLEIIVPHIALNGKYSIIGKAVILHENEDDLISQPAGNAGGRIGCGVIQS